MTNRVLLEKVQSNYLHRSELGRVIYDKHEIAMYPFSLYKEISSLDWLDNKNYRIIRETTIDQTFDEWTGISYMISYYIEFDTEQDKFEFLLRYDNTLET